MTDTTNEVHAHFYILRIAMFLRQIGHADQGTQLLDALQTLINTPITPEELNGTAPSAEASPNNVADTYQKICTDNNGRTYKVNSEQLEVLYGLGLTGEAGEVADYLKKTALHGVAFDRERLAHELGDVLWYVGQLAWLNGFRLSEIMDMNIRKIRLRYPNGFNGDLAHWSERYPFINDDTTVNNHTTNEQDARP